MTRHKHQNHAHYRIIRANKIRFTVNVAFFWPCVFDSWLRSAPKWRRAEIRTRSRNVRPYARLWAGLREHRETLNEFINHIKNQRPKRFKAKYIIFIYKKPQLMWLFNLWLIFEGIASLKGVVTFKNNRNEDICCRYSLFFGFMY